MKPIAYDVYVEGQKIERCLSRRRATNLQIKYEREGWNVKVLAIFETIVGELGVQS